MAKSGMTHCTRIQFLRNDKTWRGRVVDSSKLPGGRRREGPTVVPYAVFSEDTGKWKRVTAGFGRTWVVSSSYRCVSMGSHKAR